MYVWLGFLVLVALTSEKLFGSLLIANPVSRVLLRECMYVRATYTEKQTLSAVLLRPGMYVRKRGGRESHIH